MVTLFLVARRQWIATEIQSFAREVSQYAEAFAARYDDAVAAEMKKLTQLASLSPDDERRICVAVNDAAQCYHSICWWPIFKMAIRKRYRLQTAIGFAVALVALFLFMMLPRPSGGGVSMVTLFCYSFMAASILTAFIGPLFHSRMPHRYLTILLVAEGTAAFAAVATYRKWSFYVPSAWRRMVSSLPLVHPKYKMQMEIVPASRYVQWTLWVVGIICIVALARRVVAFLGTSIHSDLEFRYGRPAEECAVLIISLLNVSLFIAKLVDDMQRSRDEDELDYRAPGSGDVVAYFPSEKDRNKLRRSLGQLAAFVRKPWQEAMKSRHGAAGQWIASQAPRIEFFINYQQSKNVLAGNNLIELRTAMTSALVHAADSNWHLIGAGEGYPEGGFATKRWKRTIRRTIAIAVPIISAIAVSRLLRNFPAQYIQTVVIACLGFAGLQLLGIIDPDSPAKVEVASKVASMFKRSA